MLRSGEPVTHDLLELLGRHARVRCHDDFHESFLASGKRRLQVAFE
jgi:hypothetical protein